MENVDLSFQVLPVLRDSDEGTKYELLHLLNRYCVKLERDSSKLLRCFLGVYVDESVILALRARTPRSNTGTQRRHHKAIVSFLT